MSSSQTLENYQYFSLDTGTVSASVGDILYFGNEIAPEGSAEFSDLGQGAATYGSLNLDALKALTYQPAGISGNAFAPNEVFAVHTNGGNYAKVLITGSKYYLQFQFDTFGVPDRPVILTIQNNYSYLVPGQPNYGIAPGALFVITGTGLAGAATTSSLEDSTQGLPTSLDGTSVSVTVGGITTHPPFYYAIATQLALVLPSSTPVGTGTVTVNYGGGSGSAPITVVPSALGFDTLYGTGTGLGVATDNATGAVFNYNNSASPEQTIVLWGSGLGADTDDSDTAYTLTPHAVNVPLQIYIGGIQATIAYQGSAGYPGINQIDVTIPQNVQPGCAVSVAAVSGNIVSNTITLPVNPGGGVCSDPVLGIAGDEILTLGSMPTYNSGVLVFSSTTTPDGLLSDPIAEGVFSKLQGASIASGVGQVSLGSCIVNAATFLNSVAPSVTPLDIGGLNLSSPGGLIGPLLPDNGDPGIYGGLLRLLSPPGASFTFTGGGGPDVGPFTATVNFSYLTLAKSDSLAEVNRAQGVTVNWTGGDPNGFVVVSGGTGPGPDPTGPNVSFTCRMPPSAGQFTVPSYILEALPPGGGHLEVDGEISVDFSAPGLDYGNAYSSSWTSIGTNYN